MGGHQDHEAGDDQAGVGVVGVDQPPGDCPEEGTVGESVAGGVEGGAKLGAGTPHAGHGAVHHVEGAEYCGEDGRPHQVVERYQCHHNGDGDAGAGHGHGVGAEP